MRVGLRQPAAEVLTAMLPLSIVFASVAARPDDSTIVYWVRSALRSDPRIVSDDISVSATNGIVTLTGVARNLVEKRYAVLESEKIYGVRGVIDRLHVESEPRSDADIAEDVRTRLASNGFIQCVSLGVDVQNGAVTLSGEVRSAIQRQEAEMLAEEVRGARLVHNDLKVTYPNTRSDSDIRQDILDSLHRDVYLTGLPITVAVTDGIVTLGGEVGNAYERRRALDKARRVDNVRDIKDDIAVRWWEQRGTREETPFPNALALQTAVYDELDLDSRLDVANIRVKTGPGFVTLQGSVPTLRQKRIAEQDAKDVIGVLSVTDLLDVNAEPRDDQAILRDAQMAIDSDSLLSGQEIQVQVHDGVLTLTGLVSDPSRKRHAEEVVMRIPGVREVVDTIVVDTHPQFTDTALRQKIIDRLAANWETRDIAAIVDVSVTDGRVTLSGEVNTLAQRAEAEQVAAQTEGVLSVLNKLTVVGANPSADLGWGSCRPPADIPAGSGGSLPRIRLSKVQAVRCQLARGTYDIDTRLTTILDKVLEDLVG